MKEECYSCGRILDIREMTIDEGDTWWCWDCVEDWENSNNADWETGQSFKKIHQHSWDDYQN